MPGPDLGHRSGELRAGAQPPRNGSSPGAFATSSRERSRSCARWRRSCAQTSKSIYTSTDARMRSAQRAKHRGAGADDFHARLDWPRSAPLRQRFFDRLFAPVINAEVRSAACARRNNHRGVPERHRRSRARYERTHTQADAADLGDPGGPRVIFKRGIESRHDRSLLHDADLARAVSFAPAREAFSPPHLDEWIGRDGSASRSPQFAYHAPATTTAIYADTWM